MQHATELISIIALGLVCAFIGGMLAQRIRLPPLVGYLVAGIAIGPFTPGFVGDPALASQLAELGVILLMFGVGLHFSIGDLLAVRTIALPGAIVQIAVATAMGAGLAWGFGWGAGAGLVFGLALSVASTVVLLRALEGRGLLDTDKGRIAVGWLIVEDLAMVVALVLLPALAPSLGGEAAGMVGHHVASDHGLWVTLGLTLAKVGVFIAVMLIGGRRIVPYLLALAARTGSRELFTLAVLASAVGIAYASSELFGVSFALGAFFAGMVLAESDLSHQAAADSLPLQDAFAVLFFVSVGMLFDPGIVLREPLSILGVVGVIVLGKSLAAIAIVLAFGHPVGTALTIAASLAQIGEFSFILATLGTSLAILPPAGRDLILAGALLSIFVNPFIFNWFVPKRQEKTDPVEMPADTADLRDHVVLIGYGRVGKLIARDLKARDRAFILIEDQADTAREAKEAGLNVVRGNALDPAALEAAGIERASKLLIAIPEGFEGGAVVEAVRKLNPGIAIVARAHSEAEVAHLEGAGAGEVVMGEREIANRMLSICAVPLARQP